MPANLNALIRYKTIDKCLSNRHRQWPIDDLIEACSEALGEYRGVYKTISERTIRDDIRVMRSEMLGFNAPIKQRNGLYYYSDPSYSIFQVSITKKRLLKKVLEFLLEIRTEIDHPELEIMIEQLAQIIPSVEVAPVTKPVSREVREEEEEIPEEEVVLKDKLISYIPAPEIKPTAPFPTRGRKAIIRLPSKMKKVKAVYQFSWNNVLEIIG